MLTEDTWTPPSAWCPKPKWWHSETADATEVEVSGLVAALVTALQPELVVETGTNTGQTAQAIGRALDHSGHGTLDTIEHDPLLYREAIDRCDGLPVNCILGSSLDYEPPDYVGFAWLDSAIDIRHREILHLFPYFTPGAIIGVHDTGPQHPVANSLFPLVASGRIVLINLHTPRGVTLAQVQNT